MSEATQPILKMTGVSKAFGPVVVLQGVNLTVMPGEIVALVGENGAGKSTLLSIVTGMHSASSGATEVFGHEVDSSWGPHAAKEAGVNSVHQELSLNPHQTVAENILMGRWPTRAGKTDRKAMLQRSVELLSKVNLDVDPDTKVSDLDLGSQQLVELAKALETSPRLLILDEASSALDEDQVQSVFAVARQVSQAGGAVLLVSHRMQELFEVSTKLLVLKDGVVTGELQTDDATESQVIKLMLGRELSQLFPEKANDSARSNQAVLSAAEVQTLDDASVSVDIRPGWILGLGGLQGQGQREILRSLFGLGAARAKYQVRGKEVRIGNPRQAIAKGLAFIPADRKLEGVQVDRPVDSNLTLPSLGKLAISWLFGTIKNSREEDLVTNLVDKLHIKIASRKQKVRFLSGGNQQKIVLSKWFPLDPQILLLDEPTRGIDVGTKKEIYHLLRKLSDQGVGILVTSGDTMELVGLCDEVSVLYEGKEVDRLWGSSLTEEELVRASVTGTSREPVGTEDKSE